MREIIKPGIMLFLITLVASLSLGGVNAVTKDLIKENKLKAKQDEMQNVFITKDTLTFSDEIIVGEKSGVVGYSEASLNGASHGYSISVIESGYGGEINMLVGINKDGVVEGVRIITHNETPGLGANAKSLDFLDQYIGKQNKISVTKTEPTKDNQIQAITASTITSEAVTKGVNEAVKFVEESLKGGK